MARRTSEVCMPYIRLTPSSQVCRPSKSELFGVGFTSSVGDRQGDPFGEAHFIACCQHIAPLLQCLLRGKHHWQLSATMVATRYQMLAIVQDDGEDEASFASRWDIKADVWQLSR